ncbi:hypothetical protein AGOR_G00108770 [Albula goreensis]|uniref:EF-hand domain-containing protein n=1 Tax=Albula goreensis TaxID=1534307 RepID=A0A8T3DN68_9TELE|nr:hypothetical protein AGOR_G00108770 [Albula goreensis]
MRDLPSQMQSFGPMDVIIGCVLSLLLSHQCLSAPQVPGSPRSESAEGSPALTLANPFGSSDEERRLLQTYISGHLKDNQGSPDLTTWEQEIFYLFSLHDYDRSGQMDGLELMKLLSDFLSHHSLGQQSADSVVSMVDTLLQTQDLNQDGMLDPSELLALPAERHTVKPQWNPHTMPATSSRRKTRIKTRTSVYKRIMVKSHHINRTKIKNCNSKRTTYLNLKSKMQYNRSSIMHLCIKDNLRCERTHRVESNASDGLEHRLVRGGICHRERICRRCCSLPHSTLRAQQGKAIYRHCLGNTAAL